MRGWLGLRLGTRLSEYPDRAICTDLRISIAGSPAGENGRALLDNHLGCLPVVLGAAGLHLVRGFHIEQPGQAAAAATWYHGLPRPLWVHDRTSLRTPDLGSNEIAGMSGDSCWPASQATAGWMMAPRGFGTMLAMFLVAV